MNPREIRKNYRDLLNDPRWKQFSATFTEGMRCWNCDSPDELHVHHLTYRPILPWEYSARDLRVLCKDCHRQVHLVADLVWVEALRFEPHALEVLLKRMKRARRGNLDYNDTREEPSIRVSKDCLKDAMDGLSVSGADLEADESYM